MKRSLGNSSSVSASTPKQCRSSASQPSGSMLLSEHVTVFVFVSSLSFLLIPSSLNCLDGSLVSLEEDEDEGDDTPLIARR